MPTILDTLRKGTEYLEKYRVEEARLNMEHLVAHVLGIDRMQLYLDFDRPLDEDSLEKLRELTKRRSRGEPLQHLLGTVEFAGLEFQVDGRALVPRPETEELVEKVAEVLAARDPDDFGRIADIGCGSGVIGLSLASRFSDTSGRFHLADLSPEALELSRENASRLSLDGRVEIQQSDLLDSLDGTFDCLVANLPYIPSGEETELSREVLRDPPLALYGGPGGTEVIERLLHQSWDRIEPGGFLALEFGIGQEDPLRILAEDLGFHPVEIVRDLSRIPRFLFATKPG